MPSRRSFLIVCGVAAAASVLPRRVLARQSGEVALHARHVRPNHWVITEGGGNALLIATADGPVLIDSKLATAADVLVNVTAAALEGASIAPPHVPRLLINTHHHADHIGGNFIFDPRPQIIAQANLRPRVESTLNERVRPALAQRAASLRNAGDQERADALALRAHKLTTADFAPDRAFETELTVEHGGAKFELRHFGPGHTDNDAVIFIPHANILHAGDLVFHRWHPFIDLAAGATTVGWQNSLRQALKLCNDQTLVIPGHGETADRAAIQRQIDYFDTLRAVVKQAIDQGRTREQVAALDPPEFTDFQDVRLRPVALGAMHDELTRTPRD
jgi:cyclase